MPYKWNQIFQHCQVGKKGFYVWQFLSSGFCQAAFFSVHSVMEVKIYNLQAKHSPPTAHALVTAA